MGLVKHAAIVALHLSAVTGSIARIYQRAEDDVLTTSASLPEVTAISDCHVHESTQFCMFGSSEYQVMLPTTATTTAVPAQYTGCHTHGNEIFCVDSDGDDVQILLVEGGDEEHGQGEGEEEHEDVETASETSEQHCHFHAGVEHCTGGEEAGETVAEGECERVDRDYNVKLRIGLLFVILVTSALGVFGPILFARFFSTRTHLAFMCLKQFGTGVIVSTAFIHLFTHASLMFANECLGDRIIYESTPAALLMAGLFLSFLVEYLGHRFIDWQARKRSGSIEATDAPYNVQDRTEMVNIMVMEAGVVFHSLLIGLTLVVAGDSFFKTLFIVILFHQMFEGIALGSRIASLGLRPEPSNTYSGVSDGRSSQDAAGSSRDENANSGTFGKEGRIGTVVPGHKPTVSFTKKLVLATVFTIITPIGMAIGIGVLNQFNGNDPATLIAIGALDALSAGVLVWVGIVEMWAEDWIGNGELAHAGPVTSVLCGISLIAGMVLMSLLGKWA